MSGRAVLWRKRHEPDGDRADMQRNRRMYLLRFFEPWNPITISGTYTTSS
jgi:hypothetical protein